MKASCTRSQSYDPAVPPQRWFCSFTQTGRCRRGSCPASASLKAAAAGCSVSDADHLSSDHPPSPPAHGSWWYQVQTHSQLHKDSHRRLSHRAPLSGSGTGPTCRWSRPDIASPCTCSNKRSLSRRRMSSAASSTSRSAKPSARRPAAPIR